MKTFFLLSTAASLATIDSTTAQCPTVIWNDEFEGTSLDTTKWTQMVGDGCDLGEGMCGWGNAEWQYYSPAEENLQVSDGTLKIYAKNEGNRYTSARLRSLGKGDFDLSAGNYRLEARAKVPKNSKGLWPAFWMMPSNTAMNLWPAGGEIDIMEFIGKEPNKTQGYLHYGNKWNDKAQKGGLVIHPEHAGERFHVFAIDKTPNTITWLLDGQPYQTFTAADIEPKFQWPFEAVYHFILNLAIGGHWPEYPDVTTSFPNTFEIDYVRVYDLGPNPPPTFRLEGDSLVRKQAQAVQYCVNLGSLQPQVDYSPSIQWTVPPDATVSTATEIAPNCAVVDFGTQSGYIQATVSFSCGVKSQDIQMPVEVQDYYGAEFPILTPDPNQDRAAYSSSHGIYEVVPATSDTPATIVYQRDLMEVYDVIELVTDSIPDPQLYVESAKKFFLDAFSPTAAPCTRFWIQLEDSAVATPENYPLGRHSRYISFLQMDVDFQRMEFDFYDVIDTNTQNVDRIVLLIDSFHQRGDTYYLRNLVSASAGCNPQTGRQCEPLSQNTCQTAAKSEQGACTDGFNNDEFGYNGDAPMDCEDSDCWGLDPACIIAGVSGSVPPPLSAPTAPVPQPTSVMSSAVEVPLSAPAPIEIQPTLELGVMTFLVPSDAVPQPTPAMTVEVEVSAPTPPQTNLQECSAHPACAHLTDLCCPTMMGVFLECCKTEDSMDTKAGELRGSQP